MKRLVVAFMLMFTGAAYGQEQLPITINVNTGDSTSSDLAKIAMEQWQACASNPQCDGDKFVAGAREMLFAANGMVYEEPKWYNGRFWPFVAPALTMAAGGLTGSAAVMAVGAVDAIASLGQSMTLKGDGNTAYMGTQAGAQAGNDMAARNIVNRTDNRITQQQGRNSEQSLTNPLIDQSPSVEVVEPVFLPPIVEQ